MFTLRAVDPLHSIQHLSGDLLIAVLAVLLFIEESGVPLPFAPGDVLLLIGGIAVATRTADPLILGAAVVVALSLGALAGREIFALVGRPALMKAANALGFQKPLERATELLQRRGAWAVFAGRLIPGLRIQTTQVAGVTGMPRLTFAAGLIPSVLVYVTVFVGAGALAGRPIEGVFHRAQHRFFALTASALLAGAFVLSIRALARRGAFDVMEPIILGVRRDLADALEARLFRHQGAETIWHEYPLVRRLWAGLVDLLLVVGLAIFLLAVIAGFSRTEEVLDPIGLLVIAIVALLYRIPLEARAGQTVGKSMMGVSVYGPGDRPPGLWRAALRNLVALCVPLWPVDTILVLRSPQRQRLGELLTHTSVRRAAH